MRYAADPSRDTMATLRNLDSLSSRLTMRSNTCGGGPSIDSNATVAPLPADAKAFPAGPPLAHPPSALPSPHSTASSTTARKARGAAEPASRLEIGIRSTSLLGRKIPLKWVKVCGRADTAGSKRVLSAVRVRSQLSEFFGQDRSMRAYLLTGYGAVAGNVRLAEIADSRAGAGEVVIEVHAASLNPIDFKLVHGALKRISKYKLPRPIGFDASGVVTSVGPGASKFKPGDAVYVRASRDTIGTFAEQIAIDEKLVAPKPATISHAEAASLPLVGLTTLQGFGRAGARAGQRILIHAGSGGVGTFAVQYARYLGLQ